MWTGQEATGRKRTLSCSLRMSATLLPDNWFVVAGCAVLTWDDCCALSRVCKAALAGVRQYAQFDPQCVLIRLWAYRVASPRFWQRPDALQAKDAPWNWIDYFINGAGTPCRDSKVLSALVRFSHVPQHVAHVFRTLAKARHVHQQQLFAANKLVHTLDALQDVWPLVRAHGWASEDQFVLAVDAKARSYGDSMLSYYSCAQQQQRRAVEEVRFDAEECRQIWQRVRDDLVFAPVGTSQRYRWDGQACDADELRHVLGPLGLCVDLSDHLHYLDIQRVRPLFAATLK